jgi:aspartyl-tRNA synthetase
MTTRSRHGLRPQWVGVAAIGVERWVSRLTGAANIREVTLFPRDLHRFAPDQPSHPRRTVLKIFR